MTKKALIAKVTELQELEAKIDELEAMADSIKDEIKKELNRKNVEELEAGQYIIRWTNVLSNRFDSSAFKASHAKLYKDFTKQVASRKFTISK